MFKDDSVRIRHILDAAREKIAFAKERNRADLDTNRKLNLSLVRLLEIIREAARGISQECQVMDSELTRYYFCSASKVFFEMISCAPMS